MRLVAISSVCVLVLGSCGGGISASNCDEVADVTMELLQRLIDEVDSEVGDVTVEQLATSDGELPPIERYVDEAAEIDAIAVDLGCTQAEISATVDERLHELTATTDLGRFIINAIRSGGL